MNADSIRRRPATDTPAGVALPGQHTFPINAGNSNATSGGYRGHNNKASDEDNSRGVEATDYKGDLLLAVLPLICILLAFGGRLAILVLCFGGLICYIFDLLGSAEGTLLSLVITILCEVVCLVWAARVFLAEAMINFSMVILMWISLLYALFVCCNYFKAIVEEVGLVLNVLNVLMFATLPLVGAALISWFLCVEIPTLDLGLCFNGTYFLYILHLGRPRITVYIPRRRPAVGTTSTAMRPVRRLLIPQYIMATMYVIPVFVSMSIHVAIHHNVLSSAHTRVMSLVLSVLIPALLMLYCAYRQLPILYDPNDSSLATSGYTAFTPTSSSSTATGGEGSAAAVASVALESVPKMVDTLGFVLTTALVFCLQSHPVFSEVKSFSGMSEEMASFTIMIAVGLIFASFSMHKFVTKQSRLRQEQEDHVNSNSPASVSADRCFMIMRWCVSIGIGVATALIAMVVDLPARAIPVTVTGAIALAEYYQRSSWSVLSRMLLLMMASVAMWVTALSFTHSTVYYLMFTFFWHVDVSMKHFCAMFSLLLAGAVCIPTMVTPTRSAAGSGSRSKEDEEFEHSSGSGQSGSLGMLGAGTATATGGGRGISTKYGTSGAPLGNRAFEWAFPAVSAALAAAELMIREQDWDDVQVDVDVIYPAYYLIGSAMLIAVTASILYSAEIIGPSCLWIMYVIEGSKLLHLSGVASVGSLTSGLMLLAYSLPFIRHVSLYFRSEAEEEAADAVAPTMDSSSAGLGGMKKSSPSRAVAMIELVFYLAIATLATYWALLHNIAEHALSALLTRDPTDLQQLCLCVGIWLAYLGCLFLVFFRSARTIRSLVFAISGLMMLVAFEGFGHINITVEQTESSHLTVFLHPDMNVAEHPSLFFIMSTAITGLAWVGLIPLNNFVVCLCYSTLFAFVGAKAMLSATFPLSLGDDSLTHEVFAFPFMYLFLSKFLLTMSAVWNPSLNASQVLFGPSSMLAYTFLLAACTVPFFGILYSMSNDMYPQALSGIIWSAVVGNASLGATTRLREVYFEASTGRRVTGAVSATLPCATLTVFWTMFGVLTSHGYDRDLVIPLSSLILLCTPPGAIWKDEPPLIVAGAFCAVFWTASAIYAILLKGYQEDPALSAFEASVQFSDTFGLDSDVSIWTNESSFWPLVNLAQLLAPLPGIFLGMRHRRGQLSEDMMYVLAVLSLIPVFAAHISSLRYLGVLGMIFASWRAHRVGRLQHESDQLI